MVIKKFLKNNWNHVVSTFYHIVHDTEYIKATPMRQESLFIKHLSFK